MYKPKFGLLFWLIFVVVSFFLRLPVPNFSVIAQPFPLVFLGLFTLAILCVSYILSDCRTKLGVNNGQRLEMAP